MPQGRNKGAEEMSIQTDDTEIYFDSADGGSYIESLARSRHWLKDCAKDSPLVIHLDELLFAEIELAMMGAAKAKSEILKKNKDTTVRPIK